MWLHDFCASDFHGWVSIYQSPVNSSVSFMLAFRLSLYRVDNGAATVTRPYIICSSVSTVSFSFTATWAATIAYTMQSLISRFHRSMHASTCTLSRLNFVFRYIIFQRGKLKLMRHGSITQFPLRHISRGLIFIFFARKASMGSRAVIKSQSSQRLMFRVWNWISLRVENGKKENWFSRMWKIIFLQPMTRTSHVRRPTKSVWDNFFALRKYLRFCEGKNMRKSCRSAEDDGEGAKNEINYFANIWCGITRVIIIIMSDLIVGIRWMWHLAHKASPMTFEMIIPRKGFLVKQ